MKEKKRYGCQLNNEGFSLLELLIAMVILSIIVIPLLHSFVTAAKTNQKARRTMHATAVAENVMEEFEAHSIEQMRSTYTAAGYTEALDGDADGDGTADTGSYRFVGTDDTTTSGTFDLEVLLNPAPYADINEAKLADIQNLAGTLNAVYAESAGAAAEAYGVFGGYAAGGYTQDQIAAHTTKTIQIDIQSNPISLDLGDGEVLTTEVYLVTAEVQYHCDASMLLAGAPDNYPQDSNEYIIFSNEAAVKEQAAQIKEKNAAGTYDPAVDKVVSKLANIVLCVQPRYHAGEDIVIVDNCDNVETNLYLVKQHLPAAQEDALTDMDKNSYQVRYKLMEMKPGWMSSQGAVITSQCRLRTNLLENTNISYEFYNASNGSSLVGKAYRNASTGAFVEGPGTVGGCDALTIMQADSLTPTHSENRMYDITVRVYANGTVGTEKPLITMTGTVTDR